MRVIVTVGIFAVFACALVFAAGKSETSFSGEISASQCALNVHSKTQSHKEMIGIMGKDARECTTMCVRDMGGKYVLLSDTKKANTHNVYFIDDQKAAAPFAGQRVKVLGELQSDGKTLHAARIVPLAGE